MSKRSAVRIAYQIWINDLFHGQLVFKALRENNEFKLYLNQIYMIKKGFSFVITNLQLQSQLKKTFAD